LGTPLPLSFHPGSEEVDKVKDFKRLNNTEELKQSEISYFSVPMSFEDQQTHPLLTWRAALIEAAGLRIDRTSGSVSPYVRPVAFPNLQREVEDAYKAAAPVSMYDDRSGPGRQWFHEDLTGAEPLK